MTADDALITPALRALIGREEPPAVFEIEREPIRRWAEAVGDPNPLFHDEAYARRRGYRSLVAPVGFLANYWYPVKGEYRTRLVRNPPFRFALNGGNEIEFLEPVVAGDTITATSKVVDLFVRQGRPGIGRMFFEVNETVFVNQHGRTVARAHKTAIWYEGK